jgi:hypothetical protein
MTSSVDQVTSRRRGTGLIAHDAQLSAGGYTLIAPLTGGGAVYLIDIRGEVWHRWSLPVRPGRAAELLPNGNLAYNGNHARSLELYPAWSLWHGGDFYEVTPRGEVVWRYQDETHHHDARWLPNGHLLYSGCVPLTAAFSARIRGGMPNARGGTRYGDVIREVDRAGNLVWEWHASDHLDPEEFPIQKDFPDNHWPLVNGLDVTPDGLVIMSLRTTSGIIGVERESGRVRLHIPPELVSHQHAPVALENGNILAFDNGNFRAGGTVVFSRVVEIDPRTKAVVWSYQDQLANAFYTAYMGSAQRLPNGNTHITESATGRLFEVTPQGEVVWEYIVPWFAEFPEQAARSYVPGSQNSVFRTFRYSAAQLPWLRR